MNKWQAWAGRLRKRHSRIDAWYAQGAMVLLHGAGAPIPAVRTQVRSIVHMHMRLCLSISPGFMLSLQHALAAPMMLRQVASGAAARSAARPESAAGTASQAPMLATSLLSPGIATAPAFVPRMTARARTMLLLPQSAPVHLSVRHRALSSPVAAHAGAIASRLRRNVARHELPASTAAAVLASPHRAAGRAATEAQAAMQAAAAREHAEALRTAQPVPAINVEALTGMVIQQIDRRLIAYRERMGRG